MVKTEDRLLNTYAEPHSFVGSVAALRTRSLVRSPARPIFFSIIDDSHCDAINSSLTAVLVLTMAKWENSPWFGKNIVRSTG